MIAALPARHQLPARSSRCAFPIPTTRCAWSRCATCSPARAGSTSPSTGSTPPTAACRCTGRGWSTCRSPAMILAAAPAVRAADGRKRSRWSLVPLLTLGCALLLAGRIAWRLIGDEAAGFACLAMALSVPVIQQLRPLRIDHHGWQIVLALLSRSTALMARDSRRGGWVGGAGARRAGCRSRSKGCRSARSFARACRAALAAQPRATPRLAGALRWALARRRRRRLFAATRGFGDLASHCDAIRSGAPVRSSRCGALALIALARASSRLPRGSAAVWRRSALLGGGALALCSDRTAMRRRRLRRARSGGAPLLVRQGRRGAAGLASGRRRRAARSWSRRWSGSSPCSRLALRSRDDGCGAGGPITCCCSARALAAVAAAWLAPARSPARSPRCRSAGSCRRWIRARPQRRARPRMPRAGAGARWCWRCSRRCR